MTETEKEIEAMRTAYDALSPLPRRAQLRALEWLTSRLEWEAANPKYDKQEQPE